MDCTSTNFVGVIWTREGMRKMIRSNEPTVMELPDTTSGIPLVLAHSIKNTIQERKHLRKDVPQMVKQQLPNHQLHKNSHKASSSLNNSHKVSPSLNNNHKAKPPLIPNKNMSHHNSAAMMMSHFQIRFPHPQKLLRRKIQNLYQRNQNIV